MTNAWTTASKAKLRERSCKLRVVRRGVAASAESVQCWAKLTPSNFEPPSQCHRLFMPARTSVVPQCSFLCQAMSILPMPTVKMQQQISGDHPRFHFSRTLWNHSQQQKKKKKCPVHQRDRRQFKSETSCRFAQCAVLFKCFKSEVQMIMVMEIASVICRSRKIYCAYLKRLPLGR